MAEDTVKRAQEIIALQAERTQLKTMADYVKEYLMNLCGEDTDLAGRINDPEKSFIDCIAYIKKKACEWLKEQEKIEFSSYTHGIGGDVPNDICYQWAVEYYYSIPEPKPEIKKDDKAAGKTKGKSGKKSTSTESLDTQMKLTDVTPDKSDTVEAISLFDKGEETEKTVEDKTDNNNEDADNLFCDEDDDMGDIDFDPSDYGEAV